MTDPLHIWTVDRLLVCLPASVTASVISSLRDLLADSPGTESVLQMLARDGLSSVPPFVLAEVVPDGVRVVIRGELQATAHGVDGSSLALGAGRASTWNDDIVTDIASISVALGPDGNRFEWLAGEPPAVEIADPEPFAEVESHTLDEQAFLDLVGTDSPGPEPPAPVESPSEAPTEGPTEGPTEASSPNVDGAPDFSSLLTNTTSAPASSPVPAPAPPPVPSPPAPPAGVGTGLGEHDGRTMTLADLRRIQQDVSGDTPVVDEPIRSSQVRAVRCPQGHPNPPAAPICRVCGETISDTTVVAVPRPVVARLVFESGLVVDVDRPQLLGRRPTAPTGADDIPNLVTLPSPDADLSRIHTSVRLEGWDVLVQDEGSTNGTEVQLPGRDPVRLREHDPILVVAGTKVTLAGVVSFVVEPAVP